MQPLQRREAVHMAALTPVLEGEQDFRPRPEIRQSERRGEGGAIHADPPLHP